MKISMMIVGAAALVATAAYAGEKASDHPGMDMKAMDAKLESHFKEVDANGDGKITEDELLAFVTAKAKAEFATMAGEDNVVTLDEMKAHHRAKHEEMMKEHAGMDHMKMDHGDAPDDQ